MMNTIEGGVTAAKGFMAASAEAGIKYKNRTDMALVYTESPAVCAGTFTTNVVKAAPVWWDKEIVESKKDVHAVVLNSGIANACTGGEGKEINEYMASQIAEALGVSTKRGFDSFNRRYRNADKKRTDTKRCKTFKGCTGRYKRKQVCLRLRQL
ncbi:MAG: bifunctional ornithine acetyltransferase/N-acetylglutamate synthase [Clostridium sp.]